MCQQLSYRWDPLNPNSRLVRKCHGACFPVFPVLFEFRLKIRIKREAPVFSRISIRRRLITRHLHIRHSCLVVKNKWNQAACVMEHLAMRFVTPQWAAWFHNSCLCFWQSWMVTEWRAWFMSVSGLTHKRQSSCPEGKITADTKQVRPTGGGQGTQDFTQGTKCGRIILAQNSQRVSFSVWCENICWNQCARVFAHQDTKIPPFLYKTQKYHLFFTLRRKHVLVWSCSIFGRATKSSVAPMHMQRGLDSDTAPLFQVCKNRSCGTFNWILCRSCDRWGFAPKSAVWSVAPRSRREQYSRRQGLSFTERPGQVGVLRSHLLSQYNFWKPWIQYFGQGEAQTLIYDCSICPKHHVKAPCWTLLCVILFWEIFGQLKLWCTRPSKLICFPGDDSNNNTLIGLGGLFWNFPRTGLLEVNPLSTRRETAALGEGSLCTITNWCQRPEPTPALTEPADMMQKGVDPL